MNRKILKYIESAVAGKNQSAFFFSIENEKEDVVNRLFVLSVMREYIWESTFLHQILNCPDGNRIIQRILSGVKKFDKNIPLTTFFAILVTHWHFYENQEIIEKCLQPLLWRVIHDQQQCTCQTLRLQLSFHTMWMYLYEIRMLHCELWKEKVLEDVIVVKQMYSIAKQNNETYTFIVRDLLTAALEMPWDLSSTTYIRFCKMIDTCVKTNGTMYKHELRKRLLSLHKNSSTISTIAVQKTEKTERESFHNDAMIYLNGEQETMVDIYRTLSFLEL